MSVLDQIKKLDEQRSALLEGAKAESLKVAHAAIETLQSLGFNYSIVESAEKATRSATAATGTRRSGIRDTVLSTIKQHPGINRSALLETLDAKGDKSAEQSITNALSALKKAGSVDNKDGGYTAK